MHQLLLRHRVVGVDALGVLKCPPDVLRPFVVIAVSATPATFDDCGWLDPSDVESVKFLANHTSQHPLKVIIIHERHGTLSPCRWVESLAFRRRVQPWQRKTGSRYTQGMRKRLAATALAGVVLLLAGCSAPDRATQARDQCLKSAEEQVGHPLDPSGLEVINMGDALYEAELTDERKTDDSNATFSVTGDVTWETDGTETRKSMLCAVTFEDGELKDEVTAAIF